MIVCSCNVFTDQDVRSTLSSGDNVPRTTGQVYHCLGCSAQCGRCARTIRRIMDEALTRRPVAAAAKSLPDRIHSRLLTTPHAGHGAARFRPRTQPL
jgi:bacterioferritin-associated ferredoxin